MDRVDRETDEKAGGRHPDACLPSAPGQRERRLGGEREADRLEAIEYGEPHLEGLAALQCIEVRRDVADQRRAYDRPTTTTPSCSSIFVRSSPRFTSLKTTRPGSTCKLPLRPR